MFFFKLEINFKRKVKKKTILFNDIMLLKSFDIKILSDKKNGYHFFKLSTFIFNTKNKLEN